jgi:hypothetical protein
VGWIELHILCARLAKHITDGRSLVEQAKVSVMAQQDIGRPSTVDDDDWSAVGRTLGAANAPLEFVA